MPARHLFAGMLLLALVAPSAGAAGSVFSPADSKLSTKFQYTFRF